LRCVLVNGVNVEPAHAQGIARLYASLQHCQGVELLKHHPMGGAKMRQLGLPDDGGDGWTPSDNAVQEFAESLVQEGVPIGRVAKPQGAMS
jgi:pyruvate-formate lyase-activating enzyme